MKGRRRHEGTHLLAKTKQNLDSLLKDEPSDAIICDPAASACRLHTHERSSSGLSTRHQMLELQYMIELYGARFDAGGADDLTADDLQPSAQATEDSPKEAEYRRAETPSTRANSPCTRPNTPSTIPSRPNSRGGYSSFTPRHRFLNNARPQSSPRQHSSPSPSAPESKKLSRPSTAGVRTSVSAPASKQSRPSTAGSKLFVQEKSSAVSSPTSKISAVPEKKPDDSDLQDPEPAAGIQPSNEDEAAPKSPFLEALLNAMRPAERPRSAPEKNNRIDPRVRPFSQQWMYSHMAPEGSPRRIRRFPPKDQTPAWAEAWHCPPSGTRQKIPTFEQVCTTSREVAVLARACRLKKYREWHPFVDISEENIARRIAQKVHAYEKRAARLIEKSWCAYKYEMFLRDLRKRKLCAVSLIQRCFRRTFFRWKTREAALKSMRQRVAIVVIQKNLRGCVARRHFRHKQLLRQFESQLADFQRMEKEGRESAAIAIQRVFLRWLKKKKLEEAAQKHLRAIIELQKKWKKYYHDKKKGKKKREKQLNLMQKSYAFRKTITNVVETQKAGKRGGANPLSKGDLDSDRASILPPGMRDSIMPPGMRDSIMPPGDSPNSKRQSTFLPIPGDSPTNKRQSCAQTLVVPGESPSKTLAVPGDLPNNTVSTVQSIPEIHRQSTAHVVDENSETHRGTTFGKQDTLSRRDAQSFHLTVTSLPEASAGEHPDPSESDRATFAEGSAAAMVMGILDQYEFSMEARDEARMQGWPPQSVYGDYIDRAEVIRGLMVNQFHDAIEGQTQDQEEDLASESPGSTRRVTMIDENPEVTHYWQGALEDVDEKDEEDEDDEDEEFDSDEEADLKYTLDEDDDDDEDDDEGIGSESSTMIGTRGSYRSSSEDSSIAQDRRNSKVANSSRGSQLPQNRLSQSAQQRDSTGSLKLSRVSQPTRQRLSDPGTLTGSQVLSKRKRSSGTKRSSDSTSASLPLTLTLVNTDKVQRTSASNTWHTSADTERRKDHKLVKGANKSALRRGGSKDDAESEQGESSESLMEQKTRSRALSRVQFFAEGGSPLEASSETEVAFPLPQRKSITNAQVEKSGMYIKKRQSMFKAEEMEVASIMKRRQSVRRQSVTLESVVAGKQSQKTSGVNAAEAVRGSFRRKSVATKTEAPSKPSEKFGKRKSVTAKLIEGQQGAIEAIEAIANAAGRKKSIKSNLQQGESQKLRNEKSVAAKLIDGQQDAIEAIGLIANSAARKKSIAINLSGQGEVQNPAESKFGKRQSFAAKQFRKTASDDGEGQNSGRVKVIRQPQNVEETTVPKPNVSERKIHRAVSFEEEDEGGSSATFHHYDIRDSTTVDAEDFSTIGPEKAVTAFQKKRSTVTFTR